jgi:hypothetical protein
LKGILPPWILSLVAWIAMEKNMHLAIFKTNPEQLVSRKLLLCSKL